MQTVEDFDSILLRTNAQGGNVYLRDVARTELGSDSYGIVARYNGKPAAGIAIRLAAGANALTTANAVKAKVEELSRYSWRASNTLFPSIPRRLSRFPSKKWFTP